MLLSHTKGRSTISAGELWHDRLGHAGKTSKLSGELKGMLGKGYKEHDKLCKGCINAKAHDVPSQFEGSVFKAKRVGQQLHYDAFSFDKRDRNGNKHCVIVLDDYSDHKLCFFMKKHSELEDKLKIAIRKIERDMYCRVEGIGGVNDLSPSAKEHLKSLGVSRLKSDGASVNATKSLRLWCEQRGISSFWNVADNPKTASRIERAVRTVVEGGEAIRFGAHLPIDYWGDCIRSFLWIHNRLPSKVKRGKRATPFEEYHGCKSSFKELV